jgi:hypothetical protein
MNVITRPIDNQSDPIHLTNNPAKIRKQLFAKLGVNQRPAPVRREDEMQQHVARCMRQASFVAPGRSSCSHRPRLGPQSPAAPGLLSILASQTSSLGDINHTKRRNRKSQPTMKPNEPLTAYAANPSEPSHAQGRKGIRSKPRSGDTNRAELCPAAKRRQTAAHGASRGNRNRQNQPAGKTSCQLIGAEDEALQIQAEIGLRLSTVFMFDRLLFVEGPSDEAILRIFAQKLGIDLTKCNLGFGHMGGVRNFAHFAADNTLDLLSRRRVLMWFVTDHDEMDDEEVKRMISRLGDRAHLKVLQCRELENYLLNPGPIAAFIGEKLKAAKKTAEGLTRASVETALTEVTNSLKPEVARLKLERRVLAPVYLQSRKSTGTAEERIKTALSELDKRLQSMEEKRKEVENALDQCWERRCAEMVPGAQVL